MALLEILFYIFGPPTIALAAVLLLDSRLRATRESDLAKMDLGFGEYIRRRHERRD